MSTSVGDPQNRHTFAGYSKHFWTAKIPKDRWNELVWSNRYSLRHSLSAMLTVSL